MSNSGNIQNSNVTPSKVSVTPSKSATSSMSRPASVRLVGSSVTPVAKVGGTTSLNAKTKTTGSVDTERLAAIGKNLIKTKPIVQPSNVQPSSAETSELLKRVETLEGKMGQISDLPEKVAEIDTQISDLNEKVDVANLSSNYYTIGQTKDYLEQYYYTKAYVDQIVSQLTGANVVDHFDPSFLHQD